MILVMQTMENFNGYRHLTINNGTQDYIVLASMVQFKKYNKLNQNKKHY